MIAAAVGFFTLCLAVLLWKFEKRRWVRNLGWGALGAVIAQGVLGGLTVLFFLPDPISIAHGLLAQTFLILTILIAYSQSIERKARLEEKIQPKSEFIRFSVWCVAAIYVQLLLGAIMRHTESGLASPDFPTMGGYWWPPFNQLMLDKINEFLFQSNLELVTLHQVAIHFCHRLGALVVALMITTLSIYGFKTYAMIPVVVRTLWIIDILLFTQIMLGIFTVLTKKAPVIATLHVTLGAATLGVLVLFLLRIAPVKWKEFRNSFHHG
jgi:cytochrome c oxidase assembly protein subunit 15